MERRKGWEEVTEEAPRVTVRVLTPDMRPMPIALWRLGDSALPVSLILARGIDIKPGRSESIGLRVQKIRFSLNECEKGTNGRLGSRDRGLGELDFICDLGILLLLFGLFGGLGDLHWLGLGLLLT